MSGIDDQEPPASAAEAAEAEALARALHQPQGWRGASEHLAPNDLPLEAFAAARMLQLHRAPVAEHGGAQLSPADENRILEQLLAELGPAPQATERASWLRRVSQFFTAPFLDADGEFRLFGEPGPRVWALAGAAALVVALVGGSLTVLGTRGAGEFASNREPAAAVAVSGQLPEPSLELLRAQAAWISAESERGPFASNMREHRREVYLAMGGP